MTNKLPASLLRSSVVARCTNMHRLARVRGVETTTRSRNLPTARPTTIPNDVVVIVVVHRKQKDEEWMPIHRENSSVLALDRPRRTRFTLTFQCPQETTTPSAMDAPARHDVWNEFGSHDPSPIAIICFQMLPKCEPRVVPLGEVGGLWNSTNLLCMRVCTGLRG
jgi:hypothetical protein